MATQLLAPPIEEMLDEATIEECRGRLRGPLLTPMTRATTRLGPSATVSSTADRP